MTDELIEKLRAGLPGVTPGPWFVYSEPDVGLFNDIHAYNKESKYGGQIQVLLEPKNVGHIALCSPDNIAALLDRIDELKAGLRFYAGKANYGVFFEDEDDGRTLYVRSLIMEDEGDRARTLVEGKG